jgi:hypothetical protein
MGDEHLEADTRLEQAPAEAADVDISGRTDGARAGRTHHERPTLTIWTAAASAAQRDPHPGRRRHRNDP